MRGKKSQILGTANTVPVTLVPPTVSKEPVFLAHGMRRQSGALSSSTGPLNLATLVSSCIFCLTRLSSLSARK